MAKELDNKKMWESILSAFTKNGTYTFVWAIREALKDQGLTVNDKGEIDRIEPESQRMVSAKAKEALLSHSDLTKKSDQDSELTELELCLYDFLSSDTGGQLSRETMRNTAKARAKELLSIAEKEIREKIEGEIRKEIEYMEESDDLKHWGNPAIRDYNIAVKHYNVGIEDTLKKIKGE